MKPLDRLEAPVAAACLAFAAVYALIAGAVDACRRWVR